jgi:hypothetical protein
MPVVRGGLCSAIDDMSIIPNWKIRRVDRYSAGTISPISVEQALTPTTLNHTLSLNWGARTGLDARNFGPCWEANAREAHYFERPNKI